MSDPSTAEKILWLRKSQGLTQEELAAKASINLRTLQRIEHGKTIPRGQTLRLLADALNHPPEGLIGLGPLNDQPRLPLQEDESFLQWLNLSALAFWIIPFGNLIAPTVLWRLKRHQVKGVMELGRQLLSFQLIWSCLCYGVLSAAILSTITHPAGMDPLIPFYLMISVGILCLLNSILIVVASLQLKIGAQPIYVKVPFIRGWQGIFDKKNLLILLFLGYSQATFTQGSSFAGEPLPPGQLINIGGWRLHLYGQGTAIQQGPTVIFESGAGGFSFDWSLVQPQVASFARAYAYDRAGSAWSELGPKPHTMHQIVYALHTLLQRAQVPGPYVLVGASYGGVLVRLFAQEYPQDVAGMVLVDSGLENSLKYIDGKPVRATEVTIQPLPPVKKAATQADNQLAQTSEARQLLDDALTKAGLSLTSPKLNPAYQKLPEFARNLRLWATSRYEYYAANDNDNDIYELAGMLQYQQEHPQFLGSIPLIVLTRGQSSEPDRAPQEQERKQAQAALQNFSSNSRQVIAHQSGHHIEVDDPNLVTEAIREIVEAVRKDGPLTR